MIEKIDWRLTFTQAYRSEEIQKSIDKMFNGKNKKYTTKDELEQLAVQTCSILMEAIESKWSIK